MFIPRKSHGIFYLDGLIYVIGGSTKEDSLDSCEKYEVKIDKWTKLENCLFKNSNPSIYSFNNTHLFKIGGLIQHQVICSQVESYDIEKNCWIGYNLTLS